MNNSGVSMMVEYLILAGILSMFVLVFSLSMNSVLEEAQIARVVENQFSDVSAQISSQVVDMITIYPRNGNMTAKVFMPQKIGDIEYSVELEGEKIKITSEDGRFSKYLSLGAISSLGIANMTGITHSLKESHELYYTKTSCFFPTAAVKVIPTSIFVGENFTIDVSESSPGSSSSFEWRYHFMGNWSGWFNSTENRVTVDVKNLDPQKCVYNDTLKLALCDVIVEVGIYCENEFLSDTASTMVLIVNQESEEGYANVSMSKYVVPSQIEVGETAYLHIKIDGKGIAGKQAKNLTAVLTLDSSGSMGDLDLVKWNMLRWSDVVTVYDTRTGVTDNNKKATVTVELESGKIDRYRRVYAEIPTQYSGFIIEKMGTKNCNSRFCYIDNVDPGNLEIVVGGPDKNLTFELFLYILKIDSLKLSATEYVNSLKDGDFVGLVEYDTAAKAYKVNQSSPYLQYLTTEKSRVVDSIKAMVADGATNIYHALWKANKTLSENVSIIEGTIPLIILMTDGWPTVEAYVSWFTCEFSRGGEWLQEDGIDFCVYGTWCTPNCYAQIEELANEIKQTKIGDEPIRICTIGFGREGEFNETLLRNIASEINETTKCYFTAQTDEELKRAFRTIRQIFEVAATDITITDVIPEGIEVDFSSIQANTYASTCSAPNAFLDEQKRTVVKLNCSDIRLNGEIDLVIPIRVNQAGTYALDVPEISNVTYYDVNRDLVTIPLEAVAVRSGSPGEAQVEIR